MFKNLLAEDSFLNEEHEGAVAFEYVIILVVMAVAIFTAWTILSKQLNAKAGDIARFIQNNGQKGLEKSAGK